MAHIKRVTRNRQISLAEILLVISGVIIEFAAVWNFFWSVHEIYENLEQEGPQCVNKSWNKTWSKKKKQSSTKMGFVGSSLNRPLNIKRKEWSNRIFEYWTRITTIEKEE
jgi:hypothetical protein